MRELTLEEAVAVSGGIFPLVATLAFVFYQRENIYDFYGGFLDGFHGTQFMEVER